MAKGYGERSDKSLISPSTIISFAAIISRTNKSYAVSAASYWLNSLRRESAWDFRVSIIPFRIAVFRHCSNGIISL